MLISSDPQVWITNNFEFIYSIILQYGGLVVEKSTALVWAEQKSKFFEMISIRPFT